MTEEKEVYEDVTCRYEFTDNELQEMGGEVAVDLQKLEDIENELKSIKADFKARAEATAATIRSKSRKIRDGYEMRPIQCKVVMDYDRRKVFYYRTDTLTLGKERVMRDDEYQMHLPLDNPQGKDDEAF
jgi:hypothetical protein